MSTLTPREFALKNGQTVTIRSAELGDAERSNEIAREAFAQRVYHISELDEFTFTDAESAHFVGEMAASPAGLLLVAEVAGAVIGGLVFEPGGRRRLAHTGTLSLNVASDWRGQGAGRALIQALLGWAADHGQIEKVCLAALATNERALSLYRSLGFTEEGRRVGQIKLGPDEYVDEVLMARWVKDRH